MSKGFGERIKLAYKALFTDWDGSEHSRFRNRPSLRLTSQDASLDYGDRERLLSEARDLRRRFGITKRILNQYANYTVGNVTAQFLTEDDQWNDLAERNWKLAAKQIDFGGVHDMRQMARLAVKSMLGDGDIFFVFRDDGPYGKIQAIEGDRVGNYRGGLTNIDEPNVIGGVIINEQGQRTGYRMWDRRPGFSAGFKNPKDVSINSAIHVYDPDRFDASRGITSFYSVLNHMRDMYEIVNAEKIGVKMASKVGLLVRNAQGQPGAAENIFDDGTDIEGNSIRKQELLDGLIQYQVNGDEMKSFSSDRPSGAWQGFIEFLIRNIAIGVDLPVEFVWNMAGLTGPAVRMTSKQAERTFDNTMSILERNLYDPTISRVTLNSMRTGILPWNPEWMKFEVDRPAHPSIDAGRDSQADINERKIGYTSHQQIIKSRGGDIDTVFKENAKAWRKAQEISERENVPIAAIMSIDGVQVEPSGPNQNNMERREREERRREEDENE